MSSDVGRVAAADLLLVRAALHAGATPSQALQVLDADGPHAAVIAELRAGATLATIVLAAGSPLIRALAVAEVAGAAATPAMDGLIDASLAGSRLVELVDARSVQARLTARFLISFPVVGAALITLTDVAARRFLLSSAGGILMGVAGALIGMAVLWIRRLVGGVESAAMAVDPLAGPGQRTWVPRRHADRVTGGSRGQGMALPTVESMDLLAIGLASGLPLGDAVALVGRYGPAQVADQFARTAAALYGGVDVADAFPPQLREAATLLEVTGRWGAPAAPALRLLSRDLRDRATVAAEAAAERLSILLVFPTTLLLVPAFGLLVVAPLLASAFSGFDLGL